MKLLLFILFLSLLSCSNINNKHVKFNKIDFNKKTFMEEFKKKVIEYGQKSKFPDINN